MPPAYGNERGEMAALLQAVSLRLGALENQTAAPPLRLPDGRLERAFQAYGLTRFQRHCVVMALAAELDQSIGSRFARLQGTTHQMPTLGLCIDSFTDDPERRRYLAGKASEHWQALEDFAGIPTPPYTYSDLVHPIKADPRIRAYACGGEGQDAGLRSIAETVFAEEPPPLVIRRELPELLERWAGTPGEKLYYLWGEAGSGRKLCARHFCHGRGLPLVLADAKALAAEPDRFGELLRRVFREGKLLEGAVCLHRFETLLEDGNEPLLYRFAALLGRASGPVFLVSEREWRPELELDRRFLAVQVKSPDASERVKLWKMFLRPADLAESLPVEELAAKFSFTGGQIKGAAEEAAFQAGGRVDSAALHTACRMQISHRLGERAARVPASYAWEDLILPGRAKEMLRKACDQVRYHQRVYGEWGFGDKIAYGRGVSMLFCGPPGTGKTMGAQVIARELQLELYKVDLSGVVSKYIGETEKNLGEVFEQVKKSHSILFFDEADALFGKRSEVRDAHDKYANVETAYLLQKMEEYEGVVVLTTNLLQNFDEAFKRRLKFIVEFPFPDAACREGVWRRVFPPGAPLEEDVDCAYLAESFPLSGSGIKNVAVAAAFLAAGEGTPISMSHILEAVKDEMRKTGKTLTRDDFGEYYHLLEQRERLERKE